MSLMFYTLFNAISSLQGYIRSIVIQSSSPGHLIAGSNSADCLNNSLYHAHLITLGNLQKKYQLEMLTFSSDMK